MASQSHIEIASPKMLKDGRRLFVINLVDADGGRVEVWNGTDYGLAILVAEDIAADGLKVVDRVVG